MLESRRNHVESDVVDHHITSDGSTNKLVRILTLSHASDQASLLSKSVFLVKDFFPTPEIMHIERTSLGRVSE